MNVSEDQSTIDALAPKNAPSGPRFVGVEFFWKEMLGLTKGWYYNHADDPGMPKRVYFGMKPMLLYQECLAYIDSVIEKREPVYPVKPQHQKKNPAKKRRVGRPVGPVKKRA